MRALLFASISNAEIFVSVQANSTPMQVRYAYVEKQFNGTKRQNNNFGCIVHLILYEFERLQLN